MHDIEQRLQRARLAQPSVELDRRIRTEFANARARLATERPPVFWRWFTAFAAVGAAAAIVLVTRHAQPTPQQAVYVVEAQGLMCELLVSDPPPPTDTPTFSFPANAPEPALHKPSPL